MKYRNGHEDSGKAYADRAAGPVLAVGAGSSADLYPTHNRAIATSIFIMMPFMGPSFGPVIGGFAAQFKGWRWTQWCSIVLAFVSHGTFST